MRSPRPMAGWSSGARLGRGAYPQIGLVSSRVGYNVRVNICEAPGCDRLKVGRKSYCHAHSERLRRTGDLGLDRPLRKRSDMPKVCVDESCTLPVYAGGLCGKHYARAFAKGFREGGVAPGQCSVDGCNKPVRSKGMCGKHYNCVRRWGTTSPPERVPTHKKREPSGYVYVKAEGHPMVTKNGYLAEHRLVVSNAIGRSLRPGENVHHINGVRDDNRPENLELWNTTQPSGQRPIDKVLWAVEMLRLYSPSSLTLGPDQMPMLSAELNHIGRATHEQ